MAAFVWSLLGIISGAFLAVQAPINAELSRGLGLPVAAAARSHQHAVVGADGAEGQGFEEGGHDSRQRGRSDRYSDDAPHRDPGHVPPATTSR